MRRAYDVAAIRAAEQQLMARLPDGTLMQRAAAGLARRCAQLLGRVYGARVVLLVGKGDNGGDALFAGARLAARGARVIAVLASDSAHSGGLTALLAAGGRVEHTPRLPPSADLIVDGVLGIGGKGGLRGAAAELGEQAGAAGATVVAVDVPSGVDAATGRVDGVAVTADVTVTFGALKTGLLVSPGADHAGLVELVDIGLAMPATADVECLDADDVAALLPRPARETDKYRRGVVGIVAGSETYTGAAVLAVGGALRAGVGMVRYVGTPHPAEQVRLHHPEAVIHPDLDSAGRVQAWVVGSGLGSGEEADRAVEQVLAADLPVLVDADGITVLGRHPDWLRRRSAPTLLTPHAGEFARLTGGERADVEADRLTHARRTAADLGVTVLLKGSSTLVVDPDGRAYVNPTGSPALATAGSGDVLSGACGALLAGGLAVRQAGAVGAFLHGLSGQLAHAGGAPISATDLSAHWGEAVRAVRGF